GGRGDGGRGTRNAKMANDVRARQQEIFLLGAQPISRRITYTANSAAPTVIPERMASRSTTSTILARLACVGASTCCARSRTLRELDFQAKSNRSPTTGTAPTSVSM